MDKRALSLIQAVSVLPERLRCEIMQLTSDIQQQVEEVRLRVGP